MSGLCRVVAVLPLYAGVRRNGVADTRRTRDAPPWPLPVREGRDYLDGVKGDKLRVDSHENSAKRRRVRSKTRRLFPINRRVWDRKHRVVGTESEKYYVCRVSAN